MSLLIWGTGDKGKRIYRHLEANDVIAFVDTEKKKTEQKYCNKNVIGIQQYIKDYRDNIILIAHSDERTAEDELKKNGIHNYFFLSDCPGELQEPNTRNYLKKYVETYLGNREDYIIYGITLYSILIDRWIYLKAGIHPLIVPQIGIEKGLLKCVKENFQEINFVDYQQLKTLNINEVCGVTPRMDTAFGECLERGYKYTDLYDCSREIKEYKNAGIEKFKNKHKGERCFIVATGPSLCMEDLERLNKEREITFSVNSIYRAFDKTEWRPTYYVTDDYRAIRENSEIIEDIALNAAFVGDTYDPFWKKQHKENVYKYHKQYEYYNDRLPKFTDDFSQRSYTGLTVTYSCLQLAAYMGFKKIYLLGTDCNYIQGSENNYFVSGHKDFFNHEVDKTVLAYRAAKRYADEHGIKIYNVTRGGKLEVFERIDFDSLFHDI